MKILRKLSTASCVAGLCLGFSGLTARAQDAAANYWPFKVGNTWTLDTKANDKTMTQVLTVTQVVAHGENASDTSIEYRINDQVTQIEVYRSDDTGISRVHSGSGGSNLITPPFPIIKYPLVDGSKWTWKGSITNNGQTFQATSDLSVSGPETVKTAAGEFKAMRVHSELAMLLPDDKKMMIPNDYWFAPGVGMVQQSAKIGEISVIGVLSGYKLQN